MISAYTQDLQHKKDELALQYLPAVKAMAFRLKERLPSSVDYMDLSAIGTEELIKLARRYDESLNDSFWGYAKKRVYGAMLDYLRSLDIVSRSSRKLIKAIDYAVEEYRAIHDEEPSDEELAEILNESVEKIHEARIASSIYTVMPLHDQLQVGDEGASLANIEREELIDVIKIVLEGYSQREQLVIQLYYFEELSLKEISEVLNITESRISQIHKSVIHKIKESIGA
ncbi:MAG: RNA polymerase sigma factor FliA [Sulfurimonas sp.]|jgi:RNA polymerase sigma factor for flagellar operon FliA|uniref:RNA polymerase sigma factor FliA n=1 Tax=unclassified Sulfurimonas TaxID=2623549 RepID=UPI0008B5188B|nr:MULTISPECIES: RNA polymerase sigma factor FliA [unclassified Sulfurimonas]MDO8260737.1 RNA polymerase sigma factor FliA [Candidatus Magasanikbacteria bacterium]MBS4069225.1 RNA polymerase sigma factor FliA [Sulfurimonas sp.]MDD3855195.1 RNA polymerase sigma factor FliA [Sulfurimonas sp.]MDP2893693.1 RNA polymerase sigma factor FliA [Sulfurimonas sp.]MDX9756049.1 RNA polymerase sigma factor FliA [Sulfurimonas sp.]